MITQTPRAAYDGWQDELFTCTACGAITQGSDLLDADTLAEVYYLECPACGTLVLIVAYATDTATAQAAQDGNPHAAALLAQTSALLARLSAWESHHLISSSALPELTGPVAAALLVTEEPPPGEAHLTLNLNGQVIHEELAFWDTVEPVARMLPLLRERYADQLVSVDLSGAVHYLLGDTYTASAQLDRLLATAQLTPDPTNRSLYTTTAHSPGQ